ncbi:MAG: SOS response-associated peptidase [Dehalococcoidia bacterium]
MCGRFTLTGGNRERVAAMLGVAADQLIEEDYRPRWNVAPTDSHWIVRIKHEDREALPAKWGLVQYGSKDAKRAASQINARAETLGSRPAFRNAWRKSRRCVVPADGFYEWVGPNEARQPIWFHRPDNQIFFFAGLYESWQPSPDAWQRTFTIITTTANSLIAPVHDRMPVLIRDEDVDEWLFQGNGWDAVTSLLVPAAPDYLTATAVSSRVNSVRNDDPACLEPSGFAVPGVQ